MPKQTISSMLGLIPAINENKRYVNVFAPSFPSHSEHSDTELWYILCSPNILLGNGRHDFRRCFQVCKYFLAFLFPNWVFKLMAGQKISSNFSDNILC
jgi:hypothetical protein